MEALGVFGIKTGENRSRHSPSPSAPRAQYDFFTRIISQSSRFHGDLLLYCIYSSSVLRTRKCLQERILLCV